MCGAEYRIIVRELFFNSAKKWHETPLMTIMSFYYSLCGIMETKQMCVQSTWADHLSGLCGIL